MTGVEIVEITILVQDSEKHRGVSADVGVLAEEVIDAMEDAHGIGPDGHPRQCALKHGSEQRGANSLAGNVGNDEGGAVIAHGEHIKVIAANGVTGSIESG